MSETQDQIATYLLDIEAVKLSPKEPFTWASGWQSPIYCDNRVTLAYPEIRSYITEQLTKKIKQQFPEAEAIAGVATAGIPQAALVAEKLGLPMAYVRSKPKAHGMTNLIEGKVNKGQKIVVIEDLISTGGSSLKAVEGLREAGAEVLGLGAIFSYEFSTAADNFKAADVPFFTLGGYSSLVKMARLLDYIDEDSLSSLNKWREAPDQWSPN